MRLCMCACLHVQNLKLLNRFGLNLVFAVSIESCQKV